VTGTFNEMFQGSEVRIPYARLQDWVSAMPQALRSLKQAEAEALFRRIGITFAVYGEGGDPDRLIPFDMFPRVFSGAEWARLERGIKQRARAGRCLWPGRNRPGRAHTGAAGLPERGL
jgi:uncharacterized circularly permuted ATP-grasp superfamily protein